MANPLANTKVQSGQCSVLYSRQSGRGEGSGIAGPRTVAWRTHSLEAQGSESRGSEVSRWSGARWSEARGSEVPRGSEYRGSEYQGSGARWSEARVSGAWASVALRGPWRPDYLLDATSHPPAPLLLQRRK